MCPLIEFHDILKYCFLIMDPCKDLSDRFIWKNTFLRFFILCVNINLYNYEYTAPLFICSLWAGHFYHAVQDCIHAHYCAYCAGECVELSLCGFALTVRSLWWSSITGTTASSVKVWQELCFFTLKIRTLNLKIQAGTSWAVLPTQKWAWFRGKHNQYIPSQYWPSRNENPWEFFNHTAGFLEISTKQ